MSGAPPEAIPRASPGAAGMSFSAKNRAKLHAPELAFISAFRQRFGGEARLGQADTAEREPEQPKICDAPAKAEFDRRRANRASDASIVRARPKPPRAAPPSRQIPLRPRPATAPATARISAISPRTVSPPAKRQLALDEVDRLDAIGALVNRRDARIAHVLRRAGLFDEAHAAVDLDAERGRFVADVGRERLGDRRQQRGAVARRGRSLSALSACARQVERDAVRWQIPRAAWTCAFIVTNMRRTSGWSMIGLMPRRRRAAALAAFARVGERLLIGPLADRHALRPTPSRAAFIITNMAARPRFSSPTR